MQPSNVTIYQSDSSMQSNIDSVEEKAKYNKVILMQIVKETYYITVIFFIIPNCITWRE